MTDESKGFIRCSMVLLVTSTIAAVIHYTFQFGMGRLLGPADYSILAAFFSILYIVQAPVQAVQLTLTKFIAEFKAKNDFSTIKHLLMRSTLKVFWVSIAVFLVFVIFSRQISDFLNISQITTTISFSFIFLGFFVLPGVRGFLQGLQKFRALGTNLIIESVTKLGLSLILVLFFGFGVAGAVWGTNISIFLAFFLALALLFAMFRKYSSKELDHTKKLEIYAYSIPMLVALLAITALYSVDVILVKHFFAASEAGIYAAASLVAKIIFIGLMPVSNAMFPKVAELNAKSQNSSGVFAKSLAIVIGLAALVTAVYCFMPSFVDKLLFGPDYAAAVPLIGLFGIAISLLSVSYVFVNYYLALGKTRFVYVLPIFTLAEAILVWFWHSTMYQVLMLITAVMTVLLLTLSLLYFVNKNENINNNSSIQ